LLISENGRIHGDGIRIENPFESGYTSGVGLFETILVHRGEPLFLEEHYHRMEGSISRVKLPPLPPCSQIRSWCREYIRALSQSDTVGEQGRFSGKLRLNYVKKNCLGADIHIYGEHFSYPMEWYRKGIRAAYSTQPFVAGSDLEGLKSISYLEHVLQRQRAMESGFQEVVLLSKAGVICEGTVSNVFWVEGDKLFTPSLDTGILPGVVRSWVIRKAKELGMEISETFSGAKALEKIVGMFFTGSLMGIMPVSEFEGKQIGTLENEIYKRLKSCYDELLDDLKQW